MTTHLNALTAAQIRDGQHPAHGMAAAKTGPSAFPAGGDTRPGDADVIAAHPELPGLAILLDPLELARVSGERWGEPLRLERLRLKPGASVSALLRPVSGEGPRALARGFAQDPWETKRHKDLRSAADSGLPGWEIPEGQLVLVPAAADRKLKGLAALRPDTGVEVRVAGRQVTVYTLSHNPGRRFVGLIDPLNRQNLHLNGSPTGIAPSQATPSGHGMQELAADTGMDRLVLRLHSDRRREILPWTPGRPWQPGDPAPATPATPAESNGLPFMNLPDMLAAAVAGLQMLSPVWGERAAAIVTEISGRLGAVDRVPAHGDFSHDQVVVDDSEPGTTRLTILDWDRMGLWPSGWDAATWTAGLLVTGWHPGDGSCALDEPVAPEVLAAAAVLRGPEPFRRRHPTWADCTDLLLAHAERALT
ncbi:MAG: hypothetical protein Q4G46_08090 [Propionibacteriaceae bacterium]|nr:hypothetical protein [Propionibacteriaceae bacterium]